MFQKVCSWSLWYWYWPAISPLSVKPLVQITLLAHIALEGATWFADYRFNSWSLFNSNLTYRQIRLSTTLCFWAGYQTTQCSFQVISWTAAHCLIQILYSDRYQRLGYEHWINSSFTKLHSWSLWHSHQVSPLSVKWNIFVTTQTNNALSHTSLLNWLPTTQLLAS